MWSRTSGPYLVFVHSMFFWELEPIEDALIRIKCTNEKNEYDKSKTAFLTHFKRLWITC